MRSIKRHIASEKCTLIPNEVIVRSPHLSSNPYCTDSVKHERWQQLCDYVKKIKHTHIQSISVYDILQNTTFTAAQLWTEARLEHLDINIKPLHATIHTSLLTYFDNVRTQWAELSVVCGVSGETISIFNIADVPVLTIQDICVSIESMRDGVWALQMNADAVEWPFVLQDSVELAVVNTRKQMQSQWWSVERFCYRTHNYSQISKILVFPMEYGAEIQQEFDLSLNRQSYAEQLQKNERQRLREEQNNKYYQSLEADVAKNACLSEITQSASEHKTMNESDDNDKEKDTKLSIQQLREARCRFYQNA